jgi:23S rRNA (cytidine1920-2'-O)/16S rRNA (cytidine1409-2'-O)-methyltransferase
MPASNKKKRLDVLMVEKGLAETRSKAQAFIMSGSVFVSDRKVYKSSLTFDSDENIILKTTGDKFVSRGGEKLSSALDYFHISPKGSVCLDAGASTGGFTDCLVKRGAIRVYAVDVGYGIIHESLRRDPRVIVIERTNARFLNEKIIPEKIDIVTIDCSFISLKILLLPVKALVRSRSMILPLVKPQFEVGIGEVGKGGVVRNPQKRLDAVRNIREFAEENGFSVNGEFECPVRGPKGNIEYFLFLTIK